MADSLRSDDQLAISDAVRALLTIVRRLRDTYSEHGRNFTLDGRLIGDIGEVLAVQHYAITLTTAQTAVHDAVTADGRNVQIKATMTESLTFLWSNAPHYYIGLKILENGTHHAVHNGPGEPIKKSARQSQTQVQDGKPCRFGKASQEVAGVSSAQRTNSGAQKSLLG